MGKRRSTTTKKSNRTTSTTNGELAGSMMLVDPARIRFQHSRIRPVFSGCGRSVQGTLEAIRNGEMRPEDLPPIQVIPMFEDSEHPEPWYFSLNNRRLWVLKRCREEGFLQNNLIFVRVRPAKSAAEAARYTLPNCALEAKFIREKVQILNRPECVENHEKPTAEEPTKAEDVVEEKNNSCVPDPGSGSKSGPEGVEQLVGADDSDSEESDADSEESDRPTRTNAFMALM